MKDQHARPLGPLKGKVSALLSKKTFLLENTTDKPGMHQNASTRIFQFAKDLRLKMTEPEALLWERLRKKQMKGYRFRRQHPISQYIADFYCHPLKLIIEVDGGYHDRKEQELLDCARTEDLQRIGLSVIRFTNEEVTEQIDVVLERIRSEIDEIEKCTARPLSPLKGKGSTRF